MPLIIRAEKVELFLSRLEQIINHRYQLDKMVNQINFFCFKNKYDPTYVGGICSIDKYINLIAVFHYLKCIFEESNDTLFKS